MGFITMNFFPIVCVVATLLCLHWGHLWFAAAFVALAALAAVVPSSKEEK